MPGCCAIAASKKRWTMTKTAFGDRVASRTPTTRSNEIKTKQIGHNIRVMLIREHLTSTGV